VAHGLRLVQRNYRVAGGPGRPAGEIDLVFADADGTIVFVEVRARRGAGAGGAAASIGPAKRARLVHAAACYVAGCACPPPCRFDVVAIDGPRLQWLPGAFDSSSDAGN
jgi:putative endonuclease